MTITPITVAYGDGIGPEIMQATLKILKEAKAPIRLETIEVGEKLYKKHYTSGIAQDTWDSIARTKILLKAPITTPQGGGYKSLNVTLRKSLGLYANVRPCKTYHPYVATLHPKMDVTIIRENEEDIYAGIEYRHTQNTYESIKLISEQGSERIIRYAFDYAVKNNRKKVTCMSKDNIMKFTDGIFHKVFDHVKKDYPEIEANHYIIDIGTAKLASSPHLFDVVVTSNLYGDIISDVTAEISGSVGLAGSANIGDDYAMFEAIHGSAPDIAGKNIANPSGLINAAIMMLIHIGQNEIAAKIQNALLKTIEDGFHTADIYNEEHSKAKLGTQEFAEKIIENLGELPVKFAVADFPAIAKEQVRAATIHEIEPLVKDLVGVDLFFEEKLPAPDFIERLQNLSTDKLKLEMVDAKGMKIWPSNIEVKVNSDHLRARFMASGKLTQLEIIEFLQQLTEEQIFFVKLEKLYEFSNNEENFKGYSLSQGQ